MYLKKLCWKCFRDWNPKMKAAQYKKGIKSDFEKLWKHKLVWCPIAPFKKFKVIRKKNKRVSTLGGNVRFKDKIPKECPYIVEHTVCT